MRTPYDSHDAMFTNCLFITKTYEKSFSAGIVYANDPVGNYGSKRQSYRQGNRRF